MRHLKKASAAAALITAAAALSSFTASAADYFTPKYSDFNSNDVNGEIILDIPDGLTVGVTILFSSPETVGENEIYYQERITSAGSYGFELEGRDTVGDDFRDYSLYLTFDGVDGTYTDTLRIPDGNDHPNSFKRYNYRFTVDNDYTGEPWSENTVRDGYTLEIALHMKSFLRGDVDGDGSVNSADATLALIEYSEVSTGGSGVLTEAQVRAADVNGDNVINSIDASFILQFYSINSTGGVADWNEVLKG